MSNFDSKIIYCKGQLKFFRNKITQYEDNEKMLTYYTTKILCFTEFLEILETLKNKEEK